MLIGGLAAFLVATIWLAVAELSRFERREAIAAALRANHNRLLAFEQYVIRTLETADAALDELATGYGQGAGTPAEPVFIEDPSIRSDAIAAASVIDERGFMVASNLRPLRPNFNVSDNAGFKVHAQGSTDKTYVSTPIRSRILKRHAINVTKRITKADGSFGGVAAVAIYPERLIDFYGNARVSRNDLMSVIGEDGITRVRRSGARISYGEDLNGLLVMAFHKGNPNGNYQGPGGLDGLPRYFSHRTLKDYPLFVTVGTPVEEVLAPVERRRTYYMVGAGGISLLILAFSSLLIFYLRRKEKAATELAEAFDRLRDAQRIASIGDWEFEVETGEISWSDQLMAMYGRTPTEGPPSLADLFSYFDDNGRATVRRAQRLAIETAEPQEYEVSVYLPNGRVVCHQSLVMPVKDSAGRVVRLHGTAQDITARKLVDTLQSKLTHLSRIDAMNTMAATLAHELNQPLTAAANYLAGTKRMVDKEASGGSAVIREGLTGAEKQLLLAGNIIRRVRDMIADRSTKMQPVRLSEVISDALALVAMSRTFPNIDVKLELEPEADLVLADPVQVQQVLINLIRNACDAMEGEQGSELRIATAHEGPDEVRIIIMDKGNGVPPTVGDLFSTFSTSKDNGLGIGLSISRTIVEAHGGQIWVESTSAEGTTICFTLPAAAMDVAA